MVLTIGFVDDGDAVDIPVASVSMRLAIVTASDGVTILTVRAPDSLVDEGYVPL